MAVEDNSDSNGGFIESWISDISSRTNNEPFTYYSFGSSSNSSARMLQMNAHSVHNEAITNMNANAAVVNRSSDSWPSFGANYVGNDASLLLPNTAPLQVHGICDIEPEIKFPSTTMTMPFGSSSSGNAAMGGYSNESLGQGCKRQQSQAVMISGSDVHQLRGTRIEPSKRTVKPPQVHFDKSLTQLQEKNCELRALIGQQRLQNQMHKQVSVLGVEAEQAELHQSRDQQNQGQAISSPPCFDGNICSRRLMQYCFHLRRRPINNDIDYWRKFTAEYYAPFAKRRWCLSVCENISQQSRCLFTETAMESWCCSVCGSKSSKGFEVIYETLPRLFQANFDSGVLDEILFLGVPQEHRLPSGLIMLEYGKAVQDSVYENFRIVHEGKLRVTFRPDLKILSWEFCIRRHEEFMQHELIARQIDNFVEVAEKYRGTIENIDGTSSKDIQSCCDMFLTAERELARNVDLPSVNGLGFTKQYFRCLQISEVFSGMKDLIAISQELGVGPIECLKNYGELKGVKDRRTAHGVVTRIGSNEGLALAESYAPLLGQDSRIPVARPRKHEPSYSTMNPNQTEFLNVHKKSSEERVFDKPPPFSYETTTTRRASSSATTSTTAKAVTLPKSSEAIGTANAINFGENAALAIAQANLMANAQLSVEMCKAAAFSGASSSTVNMPVTVEPCFQEQV